MNKHNAIGYLEDLLTTCDCINFYLGKYDEAIEIAISALEKQIPKKPKLMEKPLAGERFWWYCGHCGASRHTGSKSKYCGYCGGKVDWSGKDE